MRLYEVKITIDDFVTNGGWKSSELKWQASLLPDQISSNGPDDLGGRPACLNPQAATPVTGQGFGDQVTLKESFHAECPWLPSWTSPRSPDCHPAPHRPWNTSGRSWGLWEVLGVRTESHCYSDERQTPLSPLSPDIWWPPVYTNSQNFVLLSMCQSAVHTLKPWGNSWWYHIKRQKTQQAGPNHSKFTAWLHHRRRSWGCFTCQHWTSAGPGGSKCGPGWGRNPSLWLPPASLEPRAPVTLGMFCLAAVLAATTVKKPPKSWCF